MYRYILVMFHVLVIITEMMIKMVYEEPNIYILNLGKFMIIVKRFYLWSFLACILLSWYNKYTVSQKNVPLCLSL